MKDVLRLNFPLTVNGKIYDELSYDTDEITPLQFCEADAKRGKAAVQKAGSFSLAEMDYSFHLYLGYAAIVTQHPEIDYTDLDRLKGPDVMQVSRIGRTFTLGLSGVPSTDESSDPPSETTPEPSMPQSFPLNENG